MTEKEFKEAIWSDEGKKYLKTHCNYMQDDKYFTSKEKNSNTSDDYYIYTESLKEWAYNISNCYTPFDNDHALLMKDLLEQRVGQYSNGTMYSSSRLIAEMFKNEENRKKLLAQLELTNYDFENFKWYLEYRLPIFDSSNEHPAQLDLAVVDEKDGIFIGIEAKMKEIYAKHHNEFKKSYKEKLQNLDVEHKIFEFIEEKKDESFRVIIKDCNVPEYCNFYYKQQICHMLGMKKFKNEKDYNKCLFLNFVFDIRDIPQYKDEKNIKEYFDNEKIIMEKLKPLFEINGIEYRGIKTQKDFC